MNVYEVRGQPTRVSTTKASATEPKRGFRPPQHCPALAQVISRKVQAAVPEQGLVRTSSTVCAAVTFVFSLLLQKNNGMNLMYLYYCDILYYWLLSPQYILHVSKMHNLYILVMHFGTGQMKLPSTAMVWKAQDCGSGDTHMLAEQSLSVITEEKQYF